MQKVWIAQPATGMIVPIIGNKKKKWVGEYYMIWVFMQFKVQDWERIWNLSPLFQQLLQPQDQRSIKMGWMRQLLLYWNFPAVCKQVSGPALVRISIT